MAERRMFAKKIINSARFLKMPSETQALYFHLGMHSDDDGIVEAFNVLRMIGATEDSLKLLMAKGFINVLNEDLVSHVTDWLEHNKIRADRKVDSLYKDLLLQVAPDTELLEPKQRADRRGTSQGQPKDGIGKDRLGKDRLGKDRLGYIVESEIENYSEEVTKIIDHLNMVVSAKYKTSSRKTKELIKARFNEGFSIDDFFHVHLVKAAEWINDSKMKKFLRPETLYSNKFEGYLNQQLSNTDKTNLIKAQTGKTDLEIMRERGFA